MHSLDVLREFLYIAVCIVFQFVIHYFIFSIILTSQIPSIITYQSWNNRTLKVMCVYVFTVYVCECIFGLCALYVSVCVLCMCGICSCVWYGMCICVYLLVVCIFVSVSVCVCVVYVNVYVFVW